MAPEFAKQERVSRDRVPSSLNPLRIFPSKRDTLTKAFFTIDVPSHAVKKESKERWLDPNHVNPEFGIKVLFLYSDLSLPHLSLFSLPRVIVKKLLSEERIEELVQVKSSLN
jgi:hypothetical protein